MTDFAPINIIEKQMRFEDFLKEKKIQFYETVAEKMGTDWVFKTYSDIKIPPMYFEGTPVSFQKKISKR